MVCQLYEFLSHNHEILRLINLYIARFTIAVAPPSAD